MLDMEDKLEALLQNYGMDTLIEQSEINPLVIVRSLVEEGWIDLEEYFNLDAEEEYWKELEE